MLPQEISTGGGAAIGGDVSSQDFTGRDRISFTLAVAKQALIWLGICILLAALGWSIISYVTTMRVQAETRKIEARRPFLERQLALYTEATKIAAQLATATDVEANAAAEMRFWQLYWGELGMVEDAGVEMAMINYGACLNNPDCTELKRLSLALACACRQSLSSSWNVEDLGMSPSCEQ